MTNRLRRTYQLFILLLTTMSLAAGVPLAKAAVSEAHRTTLRLEANLSERALHVVEDGEIVKSYPIAIGEPEHPTPTGEFSITKVTWNPGWIPPPNAEWAEDKEAKDPDDPENPMQAAKIFFQEPDYYIHGTNATHTLGEAESHGCLRMGPSDAEEVAKLVMEHAGASHGESWYQTVMQDDSESRTITLPDPLTMLIYE